MSRFNDKYFSEEIGNLPLDYNILENKKEVTNLKEKLASVVQHFHAARSYRSLPRFF